MGKVAKQTNKQDSFEEGMQPEVKKCYNSWSCIISCLVILFVLGSILYDMVVTKPRLKESITKIEYNIQQINDKLNIDSNSNCFHGPHVISFDEYMDSLSKVK